MAKRLSEMEPRRGARFADLDNFESQVTPSARAKPRHVQPVDKPYRKWIFLGLLALIIVILVFMLRSVLGFYDRDYAEKQLAGKVQKLLQSEVPATVKIGGGSFKEQLQNKHFSNVQIQTSRMTFNINQSKYIILNLDINLKDIALTERQTLVKELTGTGLVTFKTASAMTNYDVQAADGGKISYGLKPDGGGAMKLVGTPVWNKDRRQIDLDKLKIFQDDKELNGIAYDEAKTRYYRPVPVTLGTLDVSGIEVVPEGIKVTTVAHNFVLPPMINKA